MAFCVLRDPAQSIPQKYYLMKNINHREGPCVFNCPLWFKSSKNKMCTIACLHTWLSVHAEGCIQHSISWLLYKRMIAPALETAFKEHKHLKWCLFYWQSQCDQMICLLPRTDALSPQAHLPPHPCPSRHLCLQKRSPREGWGCRWCFLSHWPFKHHPMQMCSQQGQMLKLPGALPALTPIIATASGKVVD